MDALSIYASVIAVLQLTGGVISYLNDVKDAPKECQQCTIEASNLQNLLINLRYRLDQGRTGDPWFIVVRALNIENGPLDQYKQALEQLRSGVEIKDGVQEIKRQLLWKFSTEEVAGILARMERLKSLVNIALEMERDDVEASSKDEYGRTPLSLAAAGGHEAMVRLLVERDDVDADSKDKDGRTPLSLAAAGGYKAVVRLLVERDDVDADSKDKDGRTPLWWAEWNRHEAVVKLLLETGKVDPERQIMSQTLAQRWDPYVELDITTHRSIRISCTGLTMLNARCRWSLEKDAREQILRLLDYMSMNLPRDTLNLLPQLAKASLCRQYHQSQAPSKVEKWTAIINNIVPDSGVNRPTWKLQAVQAGEVPEPTSLSFKEEEEIPLDDEIGTDLTIPDDASVGSETTSESSTIDTGPPEKPLDLPADERLQRPRQWLSRLVTLEKDIASISLLQTWSDATDPKPLNHQECIERMDLILGLLRKMTKSGYCNDSINTVILSPLRECVAHLVCIQREGIERMKIAMQQKASERYTEILEEWKLTTLRSRPLNADSFTLVVRFLDLALVSFAGAHLEPFDEQYLQRSQSEFVLGDGLVLRRRSLKCLDAYLNCYQVWVFEQIDATSGERGEDCLYLSTTMAEFNQVWGPVWATFSKDDWNDSREDLLTKSARRFCVGLGYIIPWNHSPSEPKTLDDETFSHWTDDEADLQNDATFEGVTMNSRLLIGGAPRLKVNDKCTLTTNQCTSKLKRRNCLRYYKTSRSLKVRDSQTVNASLSGFGVGVGYSEQYKIRQGALLKESLLAAWLHEPEGRSPTIVSYWCAAEVSGCTGNARRRRLARILGSKTIRNFLKSVVLDWQDTECEKAYFDSLVARDIRSFEKLYNERREWREDFGRAVAISLSALLHTGTDSNDTLLALWCPNARDSWVASFAYGEQHWVGLLGDTVDSCTVVVVTEDCLGFKRLGLAWASSCQYCAALSGSQRSESSQTYDSHQNQFSILETAVSVNRDATMPRGLILDETKIKWGYRNLTRGAEFDLGESGRLRLVSLFHRSQGVLVKWHPVRFGRELAEAYRQKFAKQPRKPCHWELILSSNCDEDPIPVHVTSR